MNKRVRRRLQRLEKLGIADRILWGSQATAHMSRKQKKEWKKNNALLYIRKNGKVRPIYGLLRPTMLVWASSQRQDRHIGSDTVGDVWVSTVFLGASASSFYSGRPLLYETMTFGEGFPQWQRRYTSEKKARRGHKAIVEAVKDKLKWRKGESDEQGQVP